LEELEEEEYKIDDEEELPPLTDDEPVRPNLGEIVLPGLTPEIVEEIVKSGIDQATRAIILPVTNRVIPIALITTKQLILKDFALEPNPDKMEEATMATAKSLASQLSQITCKEPLKQALVVKLKSLFQEQVGEDVYEQNEEGYKDFIE
jgi:CCR4-NOT transcription complex subunit 1